MTITTHPTTPARAPGPIRGIGFVDAYVRFWRLGFTMSGRASRSEYWFALLANNLLLVLGAVLTPVTLGIPLLVYALASLIPALTLSVRRLHDVNKSGAFLLLQFVPFGAIVLFVFSVTDSDPGGARFDATPSFVIAAQRPAHLPVSAPPAPRAVPVPRAVPAPPPPLAVPRTLPEAGSSIPSPLAASVPVSIPPALPPRGLVEGPASTAIDAAASDVGVGDLDSTRMAGPIVDAGWIASLPDGRMVPLTSGAYFGRSPSGDNGDPTAVLVPIDDPGKSMSKTHARIDTRGASVLVTDLHSTNGTKVTVDGVTTSLAPGVAWPLASGAVVLLGSYPIELQRR